MIAGTSNFFRGRLVMMVFLMFSPLVMSSSCGVSCSNCFDCGDKCLNPHSDGDSCDGAINQNCTQYKAKCANYNCYFCITNESYNDGDKSQWVACPCSKTDCDKDNNSDC